MKKIAISTLSIFLALSVFAQQVAEESVVINIEVPVRVFQGDRFIDDLSIDDFEVTEDGVAQTVEAVYFVRKKSVERSEEKKRFAPDTGRNFFLFFEVSDYTAELGGAVEHFVNHVIDPGDLLTIVTPLKTYRLKGKALEYKSREEIIGQLKGIIRKDALLGAAEYRELIQRLTGVAQSLSASLSQEEVEEINLTRLDPEFEIRENVGRSLGEQLISYRDLLYQLEGLRYVNENLLLDFASYLKDKKGQKYVFLFYQREYLPQIDPKILDRFLIMNQDRPNLKDLVASVIEFFVRDVRFNVERVKQAYADSSIAIHFLFITKPQPIVWGLLFREKSEDIFDSFSEMARATGGLMESSANPEALFQQALEAAENYYLLYYSPKNLKLDGKFRSIRVQVKGSSYRVSHRLGYFAN